MGFEKVQLTEAEVIHYTEIARQAMEVNEFPLAIIATLLPEELHTSERQLFEWSRKSDKNDFPEPSRSTGKYKFYDLVEVTEWVTLWRSATKNFRNNFKKGNSNGQRESS